MRRLNQSAHTKWVTAISRTAVPCLWISNHLCNYCFQAEIYSQWLLTSTKLLLVDVCTLHHVTLTTSANFNNLSRWHFARGCFKVTTQALRHGQFKSGEDRATDGSANKGSMNSLASLLTRVPLGYSAERAPLWGGTSAPLSNSRMDGRRKTKNGKRKLSTRRILGTPKILLKEVRGQIRIRPKVKTTGFHIAGFRAQLVQR